MIESIGSWLSRGESVYLFIAVAGTAIFALQFILSMVGLHNGDADINDFSVDTHDVADISGLNFFSIKSIVAFVTFFGWGGYFWGHLGWSGLGIAFCCGLIMMFLTALVLSLLLRMQQSGNVSGADLVGCPGVVYLTVPGGRKPGGIVTVSLPDRTRQVNVRSDEEIKTGVAVTVCEQLGGEIFLVRRS